MHQDVKYRLYHALNMMGPGYAGIAKRYAMTGNSLMVLSLIWEIPGMTQTKLCETLFYPKSTVHSILREMQSRGFIELIPGEKRREKRIAVTEKGKAHYAPVMKTLHTMEERILMAMGEEDCRAMVAMAERMGSLMQQEAARLQEEP